MCLIKKGSYLYPSVHCTCPEIKIRCQRIMKKGSSEISVCISETTPTVQEAGIVFPFISVVEILIYRITF